MTNETVIVLGLAFLLDLTAGDPVYSFHPVRLIGNWISFVEKYFFKYNFTGIFSGVIFWFFSVFIPLVIYFSLFYLIDHLTYPSLAVTWEVFIVYSSFAFKDMMDHVKPIYKALDQKNIIFAREKLGFIVGRDVDQLKSEAIVRASIESISESFVDGFLSPVFWYAFGIIVIHFMLPEYTSISTNVGIGTMIIYRITNTLDSMVGYRSDPYEKFGKFSARVDDVMNFIPARLSIVFLLPGVILVRLKVISAIKIFLRDRLKSKSPNAAHSMSIFAGALGISLGGRTLYGNEILNKEVIGDQKVDIKNEMIADSLKIFFYSGYFAIAFILITLFFTKPV
ncbi:MAG: adenosylcobinamide-phosphate synthase CbiB [Spirochaetia bacterium]|nr:adenosylcobinamide-phosphate synthase CbiB [Spirochaetia bacterium]